MKPLSRFRLILFIAGFTCSWAYAQSSFLDSIQTRLQKFKFGQPHSLGLEICELGDIAQELYTYSGRDRHDQQWNECVSLLILKQTYAERLHLQIDKLFLDQANVYLAQKDTLLGLKMLNRSFTYHCFNLSTVLRLGEICIAFYGIDSAAHILTHPLSYLGHQPSAQGLGHALYMRYLETVQTLIKTSFFADALTELDKARHFVVQVKGAYRRIDLEQACEKYIRQGQYRDLQSVAQKAFSVGRTKLSETYANKALEYYELYRSILDAPIDMAHLLSEIARGYQAISHHVDAEEHLYYQSRIQAIEQRLVSLDLKKPLLISMPSSQRPQYPDYRPEIIAALPLSPHTAELMKLENSSKPYSDVANSNSKAKPLKTASFTLVQKYESVMRGGRVHLIHQRLDSALICFEQALTWATDYRLTGDDDPQALLETTLVMIISQYLHKAQYNLWTRNRSRADSLFEAAQNLRHAYALEQHSLLDDEFYAYEQALFDYDCYQSREAWLLIQNKAKDQLRKGRYAEAKRLLDHSSAKLPKVCLQTYWADSISEVIAMAALYQDYLSDADHERLKGNIEAFIVSYDRAQQLFKTHNLEPMGIIHLPLMEVLIHLRQYESLDKLYAYYYAGQRWQEALIVCQRMLSMSLKPKRLLIQRQRQCQSLLNSNTP